jgi:hypothetical protein
VVVIGKSTGEISISGPSDFERFGKGVGMKVAEMLSLDRFWTASGPQGRESLS